MHKASLWDVRDHRRLLLAAPAVKKFTAVESYLQPMASKAPWRLQLGGVAGIWWRARCSAIVLPVPGFALLSKFMVGCVLICSALAGG